MESLSVGACIDVLYPFTHGGAERRYALLTRELAARGHDVTVYTLKWWDGPVYQRGGVRHVAVGDPARLYANGDRRSLLQPARYALRATSGVPKARHDVVDCNQFPYLHIPPARLQAMVRGHALAVTWHEVWQRYWYRYAPLPAGLFGAALERVAHRLAPLNVAVSRHTADRLLELGAAPSRVAVVPDPINLPRIRQAPPRGDPTDVLYVGRLIAHKRVDRLLAAVAKLRERRRGVHCTIVGDGPDGARLRALSRGLGLQDHVTFTGALPDAAAVVGAMKDARVFVSASEREGFGMAPLEAMACGVPVVTVAGPMNATATELVADGVDGVVVPKPDCRALAAALDKLLDDEAARRRMGDAARKKAEAYDAPRVAVTLEATYLRLLRPGSERRPARPPPPVAAPALAAGVPGGP